MPYDDEAELTRYVWRHFAHLLTGFERRTNRAAHIDELAAAANNPGLYDRLKRECRQLDPGIDAALVDGAEAFRRAACRRLLAEHGESLPINRCPRCRCVVRTPAARQCFWCGHDWHGPSEL